MARQGTYAKGAARREEILQATTRILADDGYRNLSLRQIARELGLEPAHILYYFDSREELLQKVLERWDERADLSTDPARVLDEYVSAIALNMDIPGIVHLYITFAAEAVHRDHAAHDYFRRRFKVVHDILVGAILHEQTLGRITADLNADIEAYKLIALADGLQLQALVNKSVDASEILGDAIATLRSIPAS